jgi:hypothetical protein
MPELEATKSKGLERMSDRAHPQKGSMAICEHAVGMTVPSGRQAVSCRRADGRLIKSIFKAHAARGKAIEVGSMRQWIAETAQRVESVMVAH